MAKETVTENVRLTLGEPIRDGIEQAWEKSGYPSALYRRLMHIDQAAFGLNALTELLGADRRARTLANDFGDSFEYNPLSPVTVEGLEIARECLNDKLVHHLEELRDAVHVHGKGILREAP